MNNFTFGYACLNTELRKKNIFSSRTLRISTIIQKSENATEYIKSLALQNLKDLQIILEYNLCHNIYFMRLSSEIFPFATHEKYGYSLDFADIFLKQIGNYANKHNMRLTMHPAQFVVLSSEKENVIQNSIKELNHHCDILDRMGLNQNSVMIIHGGSKAGGKVLALSRLYKSICKLPQNTRNRIVLENCETCYTVEDLLPISEKLRVPIVIDFHHDSLHKSSQDVEYYFDRVFKVWNSRNIKPKVHVSNSSPDVVSTDNLIKKRKHSDYIRFLHEPLLKIKFPIDVMFEAKMKEQAIFRYLDSVKK